MPANVRVASPSVLEGDVLVLGTQALSRVGGRFTLSADGCSGDTPELAFTYEVIDPPHLLVLVEPRSGIRTEIRLRAEDHGTTVTIHQRLLPPELQTREAQDGLSGVLDRLEAVAQTMARRKEHENE